MIFIDWFLPGYKAGGPIQSCANLIAHLKEDYAISVITRDTDYCEEKPYSTVKSNAWNVLPDGVRVYYISKEQLNRKTIKQILSDEPFDVVYLNGIYSPYFTLFPLFFLKNKKDKTIVVAARGMLAEGALSIKKTKKKFFLSFTKLIGLFKDVVFHATTAVEAGDVKKHFGEKSKIRIASNLPKKITAQQLPLRIKKEGVVKLINIARIAPEKNLKYALEILQKIKGNVEFDFYGPIYNNDYWNECSVLIKAIPSHIKVNYRKSIESNQIENAFANYHFMLMPTQGENFGHIILESLSAGCPVIISNKTMWNDLQNKKAGWALPLSKPEQFVETIEKCVAMNQEEYHQLSVGAYELATSFINNKEFLEQNKKLFE